MSRRPARLDPDPATPHETPSTDLMRLGATGNAVVTSTQVPHNTLRLARKLMVLRAVDLIERIMGGKAALLHALSFLPLEAPFADLLDYLAQPDQVDRPLADQLLDFPLPLSVADLCRAYKRGRLIEIELIKAREALDPDRIEATLADVTRRAHPHEVTCSRCNGVGSLPGVSAKVTRRPCRACNGLGKRTLLPSLDRQKYALELAELGPKPVPLVSQHFDHRKFALGVASPEALVDLCQTADRVLYGQARPHRPAPDVEAPDSSVEPGDD